MCQFIVMSLYVLNTGLPSSGTVVIQFVPQNVMQVSVMLSTWAYSLLSTSMSQMATAALVSFDSTLYTSSYAIVGASMKWLIPSFKTIGFANESSLKFMEYTSTYFLVLTLLSTSLIAPTTLSLNVVVSCVRSPIMLVNVLYSSSTASSTLSAVSTLLKSNEPKSVGLSSDHEIPSLAYMSASTVGLSCK